MRGQSKKSWANPTLQPDSEKAQLFCQTLIPQDYTLLLHSEGKMEAFRSDGRALGLCPPNRYHQDFGANVVQINPGDKEFKIVFLNVLTATDKDKADPPLAEVKLIRIGEIELHVNEARTTLTVPEWFH